MALMLGPPGPLSASATCAALVMMMAERAAGSGFCERDPDPPPDSAHIRPRAAPSMPLYLQDGGAAQLAVPPDEVRALCTHPPHVTRPSEAGHGRRAARRLRPRKLLLLQQQA